MATSRRAVADWIERPLDSFLWMKKLTADDLHRELRSLRVRPIFQTKPWLHQLVCFYIALCEPRFLFLLDMGLGKSKILLDIFTQLQREKKLKRACIFVPRLLNISSWLDAVEEHSQLEPWHCDVKEIEEKRDRLLCPRGDLSIIDYQGLHWALCDKVKSKKGFKLKRNDKLVRHFHKLYNALGIDESHKLGNHESLWFSIVDQLSKGADYCYATTGTLFSKDVEAAWSQFYIVDRGETFGENLGMFREVFFNTKTLPFKVVREFDKRMKPDLHRMMQHRSIRYDEAEVLDLPPRVSRVIRLGMSEEQREHYALAVKGFIEAGGNRQTCKAQWFRMRQITAGYLGWTDRYGDHVVFFKENPKLDALQDRVEAAVSRSKVVISYEYTETGQMIVQRLESLGMRVGWLWGGTKDKGAVRDNFLQGNSEVLVMNSDAGGTGNDGLQKVSKFLFFYETPTSPTARQQVLKRVHRPGQRHRTFIVDMVMRRSVDAGILSDVQQGRDSYEAIVNGDTIYGKSWLFTA